MMAVIAILLFAGCFSKILIILLYNKFYEDSFKVANSKSELIKQIKLRYSNQIKLELPIVDAEKFVARYIYQYSKMFKFINVLDMFGIILMLGAIALNYNKQYFDVEVLFIAMFMYLSMGMLVNGDKKERIIINNIADYLVNNMNIRTSAKEHRARVKEQVKSEDEVIFEQGAEQKKEEVVEVKEKKSEKSLSKQKIDDISIIEEVMREFMRV